MQPGHLRLVGFKLERHEERYTWPGLVFLYCLRKMVHTSLPCVKGLLPIFARLA